MTVSARVDTKPIRRALRAQELRYPRVMADALNRTAFEILDAEKEHVGSVFEFAGASTRNFLSGRGSFAFRKATARRQLVRIFPKRRTAIVLGQHLAGRVNRQDPETHLTVEVNGRRFIAIPIGVPTTARGRVRKGHAPRDVLQRGFVSRQGRAIISRKTPRSKRYHVAYALSPAPVNPSRFKFQAVARSTARRVFGAKARRAVEKFRTAGGGSRVTS